MSGLADIAARQQDQLIACRYMRQVTQPDTLNGLSGRTAQYEDCFQHGPRAIRPRQQVEILQNPVRRHSPLLATSWKPSRSKSQDQTGRGLHSRHLNFCFRPRCECKDITKAENTLSSSNTDLRNQRSKSIGHPCQHRQRHRPHSSHTTTAARSN